jgi:hypothetical protein
MNPDLGVDVRRATPLVEQHPLGEKYCLKKHRGVMFGRDLFADVRRKILGSITIICDLSPKVSGLWGGSPCRRPVRALVRRASVDTCANSLEDELAGVCTLRTRRTVASKVRQSFSDLTKATSWSDRSHWRNRCFGDGDLLELAAF